MANIHVLVFPAGEINSIELHHALSTCVNIEVYGASSIDRHGSYVFKNYTSGLPMIDASDFFEKFNAYLSSNRIDVIFPTHDTVAAFLSENQDKINAKLISADKETAAIVRDKEKTYAVFDKYDFCPTTYKEISHYPVFIKPKIGQGSVGAKLIESKLDIPHVNLSDYIISEYLPGEEYTVDCMTDRHGELVVISPRSRSRQLAGVCVAGKTEELTEDIERIATIINNTLNFMGLWWFQIKRSCDGKFKLLEISTRCAGTMCLTRARGINLALLSVYTAMGYDISILQNDLQITLDRTLISRYKIDYEYENVYFDYDDTLLIQGKVHLPSIWFLYQCRNERKNVFLITKHEFDLEMSLLQHAISKDLFKQIIHLNPKDEKIDFIDPDRAIFIDNMFLERKKVKAAFNIPVFDVEGLDALMNWRY